MDELFKTVLILSLLGFGLTALLLCLKPITVRKFPAKWQYYVWVAVLLSMIIPAYKLIPREEAQKLPMLSRAQVPLQQSAAANAPEPEAAGADEIPISEREIPLRPAGKIRLMDAVVSLWLAGICVFLLVIAVSYITFTRHRRKNAVSLTDNAILNEVRKELNIKRHIRIRLSKEAGAPMLVGVLFPVIYLPLREISDESLRMILLHELTHYKRKDLLIKWLSIFVNAVHWFNPLAYLVCANISESCELSCDMQVTKNLSEEQQKLYMKTILELVE